MAITRRRKRRRKGDKIQQLFPNRPRIVAYEFDLGVDLEEIIAAAIEQEEERVRERRREFKVIRDPGDEKGPP
ncbi:MAG: hypothetical protein ACYC9Q_14645 [Bacillota bacterium]